MLFNLGRFILLIYLPLLAQSLNCNPAENSAVLWQCLQNNNGHITLLSGHNYTINNNTWSHTIQSSLEINSTESNIPAILVLQDISEEGLFTSIYDDDYVYSSSIILNNLDIRGEGPGKFLNNLTIKGSILLEVARYSVNNSSLVSK